MSLNEDLARNRAVFEKLVGGTEYKTDSDAVFAANHKLSATPVSDVPVSAFTVPTVPVAEGKPMEIESFSLARGTVRRTSMSLTPPEAIKAPPLTETASTPLADPLETLYHQLEVEARRSSQLSGEEGFFE